ncbi:MAG: hypothetical protein HON04_06435 [Planctomicrobium sp.]|nr:hypothetical protein [Planctomicrobium sp.]
MNPLVFHLVSGDAYFSGLLFVLLSLWISPYKKCRKLSLPSLLLGLIFVCLTAVPVSYLEETLLVAVFLLTVIVVRQSIVAANRFQASGKGKPSQQMFRLLLISKFLISLLVCILILNELSWRASPKFEPKVSRRLIIFADSITAGMGENEAETWPNLLMKRHDVQIVDHSRMGATVGSQLKWIHTRIIPEGLIFIELGGNDMFGATSIKDFRSDLDQLLELLTQNSQPVVMFELPIPPTFNRFGIAQRELASKHGVQLISKRVFSQVLATEDATLDSIHLSQAGHNEMANSVWSEIQTAFE